MNIKISLRTISFWLLLVLSISPLIVISTIGINSVLNQLEGVEEEYEKLLLEQQLIPVETEITVYKELIRFVSQLPAVIEILGEGGDWEGNIAKERAIARYTGVVTRAFSNHPEINNIQILNAQGRELLHIKKDAGQQFQFRFNAENRTNLDQDIVRKTIALDQLETSAIPKVAESLSVEDIKVHHLILQMYTPIRFKDKNIGVFVSDIDIGELSKIYPKIQWVFSDGSYLSEKNNTIPALKRFPGLHAVFASGKPGMTGESPTLSWVRVFKAENRDISLWAGREIQLESTNEAGSRFKIHIITGALLAGIFVLLVAYYISGRMQSFLVTLLSWLKDSMTNGDDQPQHTRTGIEEVDAFAVQLERLVSDRNTYEQNLSNAAREWQTTFDATNRVIWLLDQDRRIIKANKITESVFKHPADSVIGKYCWQIVHGTDKPPEECPFQKTKNSLTKAVAEIQIGDLWFEEATDPVFNKEGKFEKAVHTLNDITERKSLEIEKEKLISELQDALAEVKKLSGLLPICAHCKKIRDDKGYWTQIESYIHEHSEAEFSHSICRECAKKYYPDLDIYEE